MIAAVLADIQSKAELALNHRETLIKLIVSKRSKTDSSGLNTSSAQYKKVCKRLDEINKLVDRLYEDHVLGRISEDNFDRMMGKYQSEQQDQLKQKGCFEQAQKEHIDKRSDAERCADMLAKYSTITELTPELLNTLIDRIDVYTPEAVDGVMEQTIDIYYRYGGAIENVEFGASRFYKSDKVMQATRQRAERQKKERIAAVAKENEEAPLRDIGQSA